MWMDICNNVDGDATPFPGHSAKVANTSNWQCRAPDVPLAPWNGPGFPHCTLESATPSQTEMAACAVDKQMTTPRTNHVMFYQSYFDSADTSFLQNYLLKVEEWQNTWLMKFNPTKCFTMTLASRKPKSVHLLWPTT